MRNFSPAANYEGSKSFRWLGSPTGIRIRYLRFLSFIMCISFSVFFLFLFLYRDVLTYSHSLILIILITIGYLVLIPLVVHSIFRTGVWAVGLSDEELIFRSAAGDKSLLIADIVQMKKEAFGQAYWLLVIRRDGRRYHFHFPKKLAVAGVPELVMDWWNRRASSPCKKRTKASRE